MKNLKAVTQNLQIYFWNLSLSLPNIALSAPLIGAIIMMLLGGALTIFGFFALHPGKQMTWLALLPDFYANAATTLLGMGLTVLFFDWLSHIRDNRLEKIRLLRDINCGDHGIALRAILEITQQKLHQKGFLRYRIFQSVQLEEADLLSADLSYSSFHSSALSWVSFYSAILKNASFWHCDMNYVDFRNADLTGAHFTYSDLHHARVTLQQMKSVDKLHGSHLPNGKLYDGRFNLAGDISVAQQLGFDITDEAVMKKFFALSYGDFLNLVDRRKEKPEITDWENW